MGNTWKSETFNYFISKSFLETEYDTEQNNVLSSLWENRSERDLKLTSRRHMVYTCQVFIVLQLPAVLC